ncbi:MAG TPA: hypothetical protein VGO62_04695 [Myxococcota bacterium]
MVERIDAVAVSALGRRHAAALVVDDIVAGSSAVLLDHAGPAAALWSRDRAVACDETVEPSTSRRARALDDAGWDALVREYERAAETCARLGVRALLGLDDDGLLHMAWSPLGLASRGPHDAVRLDRVLEVHARVVARGVREVGLVVEDLAPGGADATDGVALARALVGQGATRIYASAGSRALPPLRERKKGGTSVDDGADGSAVMLASAAWLARRVDVPVIAVVPRGDVTALTPHAIARGLAGVVIERRGLAPLQ